MHPLVTTQSRFKRALIQLKSFILGLLGDIYFKECPFKSNEPTLLILVLFLFRSVVKSFKFRYSLAYEDLTRNPFCV